MHRLWCLKSVANLQNRALGDIATGTTLTTREMVDETAEVGDILDERRNDCWLRVGIAGNTVLLVYLLLTAL